MKKIRLILVVFGLLATIISSGQTTLTFRLANPRVEYFSTKSYFTFEVQVVAALAGSYLFSGQAVLYFDNSNLSKGSDFSEPNWTVANGALLSGTFNPGAVNKYNPSLLSLTGSPLKVNIAWTANSGSIEEPANSARFNEITTSYQTVVTVYAPITDVTGMAGIDFYEVDMNGQQSYKINISPWYAAYVNPNLYDPADFMTTYLGRIYANATWSQYGGTVDWTTAVNTSVWDGAAAITGGSVANASALRIHSPATLTIPYNGQLTVTGETNINTASGLTIESTVAGTGSLITGSASGTGSAVAQRYMTGVDKWHLISSPVGGQDVQAFASSNSLATNAGKYGLAPYDNSIPNWVPYLTTISFGDASFGTGKGYEVLRSADGTVSFTGTPAAAATSIGITNAATGKWWNLVGNPYPSAIYANESANATNFLTTNVAILEASHIAIYIWDPAAGYQTIAQASPATYVPAEQAFFVRAGTGGTANFTTGMKTHSTSGFKSGQNPWPSINIKATIADKNRNAQVYYIPGMTLGMDPGYDAGMFEDNNPAIALSTHIEGSEIDFAIQSLPNNDYENIVVPVGLNGPQGSNVRFTADVANLPFGIMVYLEDRAIGKFIRLDEAGSFYSINLSSVSNGTGRFYLHTSQHAMGIGEQMDDLYTIIPLPQERIIRVLGITEPNALATIYEMNGAVVTIEILHNIGENIIPFMPLSSGIYLLKIQTGTSIIKRKINWVYVY